MSSASFSRDPGPTGGTPGGDKYTGNASGTKEQAQQAADTAKDESKRVAGVAKQEAKSVADEAKNHARGLLNDATSQVESQSKEQKTKLAETVRTFGDDLDSMRSHSEGSDGLAAQLVQQVAQQARSLASHLDDRDPRELLDDVRSFARRSPGTFLLGALTAGVVVGRLTRGAKAAQDQEPSTSVPTTPDRGLHDHPATPSPALSDEIDAPLRTQAPPTSSLGTTGVELSESGIVGPDGGRA